MNAETIISLMDAQSFLSTEGRLYMNIRIRGDKRSLLPLTQDKLLEEAQLAVIENGLKLPSSEQAHIAYLKLRLSAECSARQDVWYRVAHSECRIVLDLCNLDAQTVVITSDGWSVSDDPVCNFAHTRLQAPLPEPERDGCMDEFFDLFGLSTHQRRLLTFWLLQWFTEGPYAVLAINGTEGSGKSTLTNLIRDLVDPAALSSIAVPSKERNLMILARQSRTLAFDNLSGLPAATSDAICRLATGAGSVERKLYSNDEVVPFRAQVPMILNGITDVINRPDLADRTIFLKLEKKVGQILAIKDIRKRFEEIRARVLGSLLDAVVAALRQLPNTRQPDFRLADAARFVKAAESHLGWPENTVDGLCEAIRLDAKSTALESAPVAQAVLVLFRNRNEWSGTASELLSALESLNIGPLIRSLPERPEELGKQLRRCAGVLMGQNITHEYVREGVDGRRIHKLGRAG